MTADRNPRGSQRGSGRQRCVLIQQFALHIRRACIMPAMKPHGYKNALALAESVRVMFNADVQRLATRLTCCESTSWPPFPRWLIYHFIDGADYRTLKIRRVKIVASPLDYSSHSTTTHKIRYKSVHNLFSYRGHRQTHRHAKQRR